MSEWLLDSSVLARQVIAAIRVWYSIPESQRTGEEKNTLYISLMIMSIKTLLFQQNSEQKGSMAFHGSIHDG